MPRSPVPLDRRYDGQRREQPQVLERPGETVDYNGRVLSIRQEDLRTLAVIYDETPSQLTEQLIGWGVLGLMDAVEKFDPAQDVKFSSYATIFCLENG